jgi:hypothetical protein
MMKRIMKQLKVLMKNKISEINKWNFNSSNSSFNTNNNRSTDKFNNNNNNSSNRKAR